jgi:MFS family permease
VVSRSGEVVIDNSRRTFAIVVCARSLRAFGFGVVSVGLALYLSARGLSTFAVGAMLTLALAAGAVSLLATPPLVRKVGQRSALLLGAAAMCASGALLGLPGPWFVIAFACLLGTLSAGGQEVGPFAAIEQRAIVECRATTLVHSYAVYNLAGAIALALGALAAAGIPTRMVPLSYALCAVALIAVYGWFPEDHAHTVPAAEARPRKRSGMAERLSLLFGLDALAGGFVVQSFMAYWFHLRFGVDQHILGFVFFGANLFSALSYLVASKLSARIGLVRTMVFTHLPSNILLGVVPFMPTFALASIVLLARFALSQMDVPTRQALTMEVVAPDERTYAAALTNAVRPASAAIAPIFSGLAMQTAAIGLPFFIAGGLKIVYDLVVFALFGRLEKAPKIQ